LDPEHNPFFRYARLRLFGAFDSGRRLVGRIAAIHNPLHEREHGEAAGFFGFFECINSNEVAQSLLEAVGSFVRTCGCSCLIGPVNPSTNDESGLLLDNFNERPTFMTNYCHEYYHSLFTYCGFRKAIDTLSYQAETAHIFPGKYERVLNRVLQNPTVSVRRFSRAKASGDIAIIREIYNLSFRGTWGFVPLSEAEAQQFAESFLSFADLDLVWLAYCHNEPVGFILGLPDLNEILARLNGRLYPFGILKFLTQRNRINGMRVVAFGVLPGYRSIGIETLLVNKVRERILTKVYRSGEFSVVMEDNHRVRNLVEGFGFQLRKRYRIYRKEL